MRIMIHMSVIGRRPGMRTRQSSRQSRHEKRINRLPAGVLIQLSRMCRTDDDVLVVTPDTKIHLPLKHAIAFAIAIAIAYYRTRTGTGTGTGADIGKQKFNMLATRFLLLALFVFVGLATAAAAAFAPQPSRVTPSTTTTTTTTTTALRAENEDLMRWARQSRSAGAEDNLVELNRPLGLVLNQDENGNVFVETVAPKGNAARTGKVKEGDIVTMCSATFGDEMWSTRGVGLSRVLAAIRVRAGPTVKLVLESPTQYKKKAAMTTAQRKAADDARASAQAKKDSLLAQLEEDEKKLKKGKFFGLF